MHAKNRTDHAKYQFFRVPVFICGFHNDRLHVVPFESLEEHTQGLPMYCIMQPQMPFSTPTIVNAHIRGRATQNSWYNVECHDTRDACKIIFAEDLYRNKQ